MITDAMLKEAAAEAERFMLAHLPEIQEPHVFSKRFERKMQKLLLKLLSVLLKAHSLKVTKFN